MTVVAARRRRTIVVIVRNLAITNRYEINAHDINMNWGDSTVYPLRGGEYEVNNDTVRYDM